MINVGIIGFGGIGHAHLNAYRALQKRNMDAVEAENKFEINVVAIADCDEKKFTEEVEINIGGTQNGDNSNINFYTSMDEMLANEKLDLIDICLPTYLHKEVACQMLEKGYHVLSEKPMALSYAECKDIEESAKNAKGECMIGQCLRFYPQYIFLKQMVDSKKYGNLISCDFYRFSGRPKWGFENWFMNKDKSGGCVLDLHIHDVDIIRYIFGEPKSVSALARTVYEGSEFDSINSRFMYNNNTIITAYGDWAMPLKFGFRHGYRANFENRVVVFENDTVKVYTDDEVVEHSFDRLDGIENEIEYLIGCIINDKKVELNTPNSAMKTVRLVELLKDSARENGKNVEV